MASYFWRENSNVVKVRLKKLTFKIFSPLQADEFDGKVTYGQKRKEMGPTYEGHASQLAPTLAELAKLEKEAQLVYLQKFYGSGKQSVLA